MDIPTILDQLAHAEGMPEGAIHAAREQRAAVAPALIDLIERHRAGEAEAFADEDALFYAFHLLGEWRETAAYRPLARLLALEEDEVEDILGDAVTETVHRIMAQVFDGDPRPLYEVIEAEQAHPYVRSRMLETLALLVLRGQLPREEVARYLRDAFSNLRPHDSSFVWYGWQSAIAALGLATELESLVRKAFARNLIDPGDMSLADFEADLKHARAHPESPWRSAAPDEFAPFEDTIAELATWRHRIPDDLERGLADDWGLGLAEPGPASNPFRHVGRNDPCPCGSGKKFKRCCLA